MGGDCDFFLLSPSRNGCDLRGPRSGALEHLQGSLTLFKRVEGVKMPLVFNNALLNELRDYLVYRLMEKIDQAKRRGQGPLEGGGRRGEKGGARSEEGRGGSAKALASR